MKEGVRWREAWERWVVRYFGLLLVVLILLPSGVAYFWGPGWGVVIGIGAAVAYSALAGDAGLGEIRWLLWGVGINLIIYQVLFLLYLLNQLARARLGAG
jgi:hypothetical protein